MSTSRIPGVLHYCKSMFLNLMQTSSKNSILSEVLSLGDQDDDRVNGDQSTLVSLDNETLEALLLVEPDATGMVHQRTRFQRAHVTYSTCGSHLGNSLVILNIDDYPLPVSIQRIFTLAGDPSDTLYVAVRRHEEPAPSTADNPFARYPVFAAQVCSEALSEEIEVYKLDDIQTHCARTPIGNGLVVIVPLSRD